MDLSVWHIVAIFSLSGGLAALLRQSFLLSREIDRKARKSAKSSEISEPLLSESHENLNQRANSSRCRALDVFRGFTLCLMVFVNYGGGGFAVFRHSVWDGLTIADLVFPWFAWTMGFSIFLSSSVRRHPLSRIVQRAVKLFVVGLFVNNGNSWNEWRIPGVLQALGVAYLVVAVADWFFPFRENGARQQHIWSFVSWHLIFGVLPFILVNLLLTFALHVPGCPTGYLGPGGLADSGAYRNCTGGAHLYVDTLVFGLHHIFQTPTCQIPYQTGPYDPEGLVNWLMVASTAYIGYLQAAFFAEARSRHDMVLGNMINQQHWHLLLSGSALVLLSIVSGGLWLFLSGPWIPLNKNLWSLSYALLSSGLATLLLALLVKLVTGKTGEIWRGSPFVSVGNNSIAIYVMHEICQNFAPFAAKPVNAREEVPPFELLLFNLVGMMTWIVTAQWMDIQRVFIKV